MEPPSAKATRWSGTAIAEATGVSVSSVQRLARLSAPAASHLAVQAVQRPPFVDKLRDVDDLYLDPHAHAVVLSIDEKSRIQACGNAVIFSA